MGNNRVVDCSMNYHGLTKKIITMISSNNFRRFDELVDHLVSIKQGYILGYVMTHANFFSEYIKARFMYKHHIEVLDEAEKLREKYENE